MFHAACPLRQSIDLYVYHVSSFKVSDEGDVLYVFPRDYRSKLATKSLRVQIEPFLDKAKVLSFAVIQIDLNFELLLISSEVSIRVLQTI